MSDLPTIPQAAAMLSVSTKTLRRIIGRGALLVVRLGFALINSHCQMAEALAWPPGNVGRAV
jgi:hypothetical protein